VGLDFVSMRPVVATSVDGLFSWGTQNNPEITLRRNLVPILLAAADPASAGAASDENFMGRAAKHVHIPLKSGEDVGLYFDPQSKLLVGFETTDSEALTGDVPAQYALDNYKAVDGVMLPHRSRSPRGGTVLDCRVRAARSTIRGGEGLRHPRGRLEAGRRAIAAGVFSPVALDKIADGASRTRVPHNSLVVEFPQWLAVVEAPYTNAQTATLVRVLAAQFPGKPIKFAAVTHPHSDHIGGVRGIASAGATVLVEKAHEPPLRTMLEAHHTHPMDDLEKRRSTNQPVGVIETYEGKKVISDGKQSLELYAFTGSPHAEPMVLAYVPTAKVAFQSDLWFPGTGGAGNPAAKQLLDSMHALKLNIATDAGGHGGVAPHAELEKAIAAMK
jgi:glyoxylase-like metal-dependent hydrolase (beta-lactamase superfamily II)